MSNQEVVNFILESCYDMTTNTRHTPKTLNIAKQLAEFAIQKGSTDNVSVIVVFLQ